jgi:hypothetical protein
MPSISSSFKIFPTRSVLRCSLSEEPSTAFSNKIEGEGKGKSEELVSGALTYPSRIRQPSPDNRHNLLHLRCRSLNPSPLPILRNPLKLLNPLTFIRIIRSLDMTRDFSFRHLDGEGRVGMGVDGAERAGIVFPGPFLEGAGEEGVVGCREGQRTAWDDEREGGEKEEGGRVKVSGRKDGEGGKGEKQDVLPGGKPSGVAMGWNLEA